MHIELAQMILSKEMILSFSLPLDYTYKSEILPFVIDQIFRMYWHFFL